MVWICSGGRFWPDGTSDMTRRQMPAWAGQGDDSAARPSGSRGRRLNYVRDRFDPATGSGRLTHNVLATVAQFETEVRC